MAFNGSGTFARLYNWATDRSNGIKINSARMDSEMDGFAAGLSNAVCRDGQSTISNNIPFNNKRITGLGNAEDGGDALNQTSGDARYQFHPADLTQETTISDTDEFPFFDASASVDRTTLWSNIKDKLKAAEFVTLPTGTKMLFMQTNAPTGWTKDTTHNNKALRIVSGTASSGGSTGFTSVFAARTLNKNQIPDMQVSIVDPTHVHSQVGYTETNSGGTGSSRRDDSTTFNTGAALTGITAFIDNTARGGVAQQSIDFAVAYVDIIAATKD